MNSYYLVQNEEAKLIAYKMGPAEEREEHRADLIEERILDQKYYRRNMYSPGN